MFLINCNLIMENNSNVRLSTLTALVEGRGDFKLPPFFLHTPSKLPLAINNTGRDVTDKKPRMSATETSRYQYA